MDRERVVVAEILRPRGIRGELIAKSQTGIPGRLESLRRAQARLADGSDVPIQILEAWEHKDDWVLKLAGVDSIDAAEPFRRADIWVPLSDRATLSGDEYFRSDLVGCRLIEAATGKCLGTVEGWQEYNGPPLMEVKVGGREALIPFVKGIYRQVDLVARTITVDLPEGLLEL
ncbi:MAG: ribosome maturation factor RimM [Bryobacteraceae bacterium]